MPSTIVIRHLETLFKTLNRGIVFLDRDGTIISTNVAILSLLGRPFLDLIELPSGDPEICVLGDDERPVPARTISPDGGHPQRRHGREFR